MDMKSEIDTALEVDACTSDLGFERALRCVRKRILLPEHQMWGRAAGMKACPALEHWVRNVVTALYKNPS